MTKVEFSESERQAQARKACLDFAARTTVLLAPHGKVTGLGSGVLLQTGGGVPFVVTARHVVEEVEGGWEPLRMMVPGLGGKELFDVGAAVYLAPNRKPKQLDVAVVALRPSVHEVLRPLCAGRAAVVVADNDDLEPSDVVFLAGFPSYLGFQNRQDPREYLAATLTYFTGVKGHDVHGRLEVEWGEAIPDKEAPVFPHLDVLPGVPMQLQAPFGVSGGGIWRVRGARGDALWSPSSHAKLIGVPSAWNQRNTQYAESVSAWGPWLTGVANDLDGSATAPPMP